MKIICNYCQEEIKPNEPKVPDDIGEGYFHLDCAIKIDDGDVIENEQSN